MAPRRAFTSLARALQSSGALMTQRHPRPVPQQRGITLIEVAMVLAIAAVVIGGAMALYLSTSNQRKTTETTQLVVSAVQKLSDLYQGQDMKGLTGQIAVAFGVLPKTYQADAESYHLPLANAKMTFGATAFDPGPNFGIIQVGPLTTEACMALGKLELGSVVKYVIIDNTQADFRATAETELAARSVKDAQGEVTVSALSKDCTAGSFVRYYLTN